MTYNGKQGYLTVSPINSSTYMTNYAVTSDGEGTIVCTGTNKNGVILSNSLNFTASYYAKGSSGALSANFASVNIPKGAIPQNGTVVLASSDNTTSYEGLLRMSKNVDLALPVEQSDKALEITIPVDDTISNDSKKVGLYRATTNGHKWVGPVKISNGKAKGNVDVSASLFIAADETAPVISNDLEPRGNGKYAVKINDLGSGVCSSTVKVVSEGKTITSVFSDDELVFDTSTMKASKNQTFEIEAADNVGNVGRATLRAVAGATNLAQLVAYPNPAKNRSVIRATVTGANRANGNGSIKIYDLSGHKVLEGTLVNRNNGIYEFDWDLNNKKGKIVANGAYLADIKLNVGGNSYKERIKIAVLR
jgi:flagellar hook assembly protein FlgD